MPKLLVLFIIFSCYFSSSLTAQLADDDLRNEYRNTVMATSGLNLRDAPGLHGQVLDHIPFGTTLKFVDRLFHNREDHANYRSMTPNAWAYVDYNGTKGYVYDAYLAFNNMVVGETYYPSHVNQDFVMAQRGIFMHRLIPNFKDYQWYGIYHLGANDIMAIRKIDPEIRYGSEETSGGLYLTLGKDFDSDPLYFIGSKRPLSTGLLEGYITDRFGQPLLADDKVNYTQLIELGVDISIVPEPKIDEPRKRLEIDTHFYPFPLEGTPLGLKLMADLNQDGQADYLIYGHAGGQDIAHENVLYLSHTTRAFKPLEAVAIWTSY